MTWDKKGLIWNSELQGDLGSHSMIPTPIFVDNNRLIRIYYSIRDKEGKARPFFIEVESENPFNVVTKPQGPLLELGLPGTFDANGAAVCSVIQTPEGLIYMYYVGFEIPTDIRYRMFTGLAISTDGGLTFKKHSQTPILDRSNAELYFRCGPYVFIEDGIYKMYYVAGSSWIEVKNEITPQYSLKYVESSDGISWSTEGLEILTPNGDSYAYGRPWLYEVDGLKYIVISTRKKSTKSYEIENFRIDERKSLTQIECQLPLGTGGNDNEMIAYASVLKYKQKSYCFFNGNGFGRNGINLAEF
jgi:hypothetical protein